MKAKCAKCGKELSWVVAIDVPTYCPECTLLIANSLKISESKKPIEGVPKQMIYKITGWLAVIFLGLLILKSCSSCQVENNAGQAKYVPPPASQAPVQPIAPQPIQVQQEPRESGPPDFRNARWDMRPSEINEYEGSLIFASPDSLLMVYSGTYMDMPGYLSYYFPNKKLAGAQYLFAQDYDNAILYFEDLQKLGKLLIRKYGEPIYDSSKCLDMDYCRDRAMWGYGLKENLISRHYGWRSARNIIKLQLYASDGMPLLSITYFSRKMGPMMEKNLEDQMKAKLRDL